ncbi:lytic transglycosylase domain-containing protein [Sphingomonas jatrophae]|uniref:Soluble lytic murein transglycosylase n=1 Tax=Sphingomonas jatrophae TaxID=1166337 RepID=A0A1I6JIR9_9SPHN|nr:lytic transglycosylase domain-containing protein [Sphingomonas jatrophae]SFR78867.1 Soluble lytic murein transglycosylase [Sphingomonas jatrophae]
MTKAPFAIAAFSSLLAAPAVAADTTLPAGFAMQARTSVSAAAIVGTTAPAGLTATPALPPARPTPAVSVSRRLPALLTPEQRDNYRAIFAAMRAEDWSGAAARLDGMGDGPLHAVVRAELILAKNSPRAEPDRIVQAIAAGPDLPEAQQLAAMARKRGVTSLPAIVTPRDLVRLAGASKRSSARSVREDAAAAALASLVQPMLKEDRLADAEAALDAAVDLSSEARTEWQQRLAWAFFQAGDDAGARRLAARAQAGSGDWAVQADWVAGLAAWRSQDCDAAGRAFDQVSRRGRDGETIAAGLFWSARADTACQRPQLVQAKLRSAARMSETFYGLVATAALGTTPPAPPAPVDLAGADWSRIEAVSNLRTAVALAEVGERGLADELLRHQARIGRVQDHETLIHLAARLDLPATQVWLAQNGPAGTSPSLAARYPQPGWTPAKGWRVDKALIYAHALQESRFRIDATSPAGARGLMQLMPGTVDLVARRKGEPSDRSRMTDPAFNLEYGQSYLEQLRDGGICGGLLPKVIAAYNAGPGNVAKWNERSRNAADPLLFIEAIPFAETRAYVAIVLRNYWMYQRTSGAAAASLKAIAQGMWPRFPGLPGKSALRLGGVGATASAE